MNLGRTIENGCFGLLATVPSLQCQDPDPFVVCVVRELGQLILESGSIKKQFVFFAHDMLQ
jgi:hypothetical protein